MKILLRRHHYLIIISLLCIGYVIFLLPFYLVSYYAPDFTLYFYVAEGALNRYGMFVPHDGFSALFLHVALFIAQYPKIVSLLSLLLQAIGIFALLYYLPKILDLKNATKYLVVFFLFSCGFLYYFYSKLFYDFPFTLATFGIILALLWQGIKIESKRYNYWFDLLYIVLGICLSWKPYNIFLVIGFLGLLYCNVHIKTAFQTRIFRSSYMHLIRLGRWVKWIVFFGIGYIIGNYPLLYNLPATLQGLRAYPASSNPISFFFTLAPKPIWDHVNMMPFNSSSMLLSSILLVVIITVLLKRWRYLMLLSLVMIAFIVFIALLSPGLPWHGFPLALFLLCYFIFILKELEINPAAADKKKWLWVSVVIASALQFGHTFLWYIPKQVAWHNATQLATQTIEEQRLNIRQDIAELSQTVTGTVYVDLALKRQLLKPTDDSSSYYRSDPLVTEETLYHHYYDYPQTADYVIYVEPTIFQTMADVARIRKYDEKTPLYSIVQTDYTISLYRND